MRPHRRILVLALALAAAAAWAQPVRVLVSLSAPSQSVKRLADSLDAALAKSPAVLAVVRSPRDRSVSLESFARSAGCRLVLTVEATPGSRGGFGLLYTLKDSGTEGTIGSGILERFPSEDSDLASWFWSEIVAAVEVASVELPASAPAEAALSVTLTGQPGARISGFGEDLVMPDSGELVIPMKLPAYVEWRAVQDGAWDESGTAVLTESSARIAIARRPFSRWAVETGLWGLAFPELRATWQLEGRYFLRASISQFLAGLSLSSSHGSPSQASIFASYGLIQPGIGAGLQFTDLRSSSRFYASLDLFLRVATPSPQAVFIDPVAPFGLLPAAGFEWGRAGAGRVFIELGMVLYPWANPGLMLASLGGERAGGRLLLGGLGAFQGHPGWFTELPLTRAGLRFYL